MESGDVKRAESEVEDTATPRSNGAIPCLAQAPHSGSCKHKKLARCQLLTQNRQRPVPAPEPTLWPLGLYGAARPLPPAQDRARGGAQGVLVDGAIVR